MSATTDQPRPTPDQPFPAQIGRYNILGRLGAGGMGEVYKAHDPQLDRVVALKLPHFTGPPEIVALRVLRFQREGRAAARVFHPHVCPVFDVGEHEGRPFVVMAYVEGQSLEQRLAASAAPEEVGAAIRLFLQVLEGLAAIHAAGIIHRDLKPANILLDAAGRAMLTDFGLARPEHDGEPLTSDGVVMGTPHYMAPEQASGQGDRVGPWTDVYGAGVVLYRMLTGRLPFEGPPLAVLSKIANDPVPPPSRWRPDLPAGLDAVLLKALAKEAEERYAAAAAFAEALKNACPQWADAPAPAAPQAAAVPSPQPFHAPALALAVLPRRRLLVWMRLLIAGLLVAVVGGAIGAYHDSLAFEESWWYLASCAGWPLAAVGFCLLMFALMFRFQLTRRKLWSCSAAPYKDWMACGRLYVREILAVGLPVDCRDELGETALLKASESGQSDIVKLLLAHSADVRPKNRFGQTALGVAEAKGHGDIAKLLRQAGATE